MNTDKLEQFVITQYETTVLDFQCLNEELNFRNIQKTYCHQSYLFEIFASILSSSYVTYLIMAPKFKNANLEIVGNVVLGVGRIFFSFILMFLIGFFLWIAVSTFFSQTIIFTLHKILPNREKRENEILTYFQVQKELYDKENFKELPCDLCLTDWKTMTNNDFCQKYFNIQSKNFVRYFKERAEIDGEIQENFILFATNLPKLELLPLDSLRKILINPPEVKAVSKNILNLIFEDYTPIQIERIFTNHVGKTRFDELGQLKQKAQIYSNFKSLLDSELIPIKPLSSETKKIDGAIINDFKIKVLKTAKDYTEASNIFSNCVRGYTETEGDILTFFLKGEASACVHIQNKYIKQISGYNNSTCTAEVIIRQILKENNIIH